MEDEFGFSYDEIEAPGAANRRKPSRVGGDPALMTVLVCAVLHVLLYLIAPLFCVNDFVNLSGAQCISYHLLIALPPLAMGVTAALFLLGKQRQACVAGCSALGVQTLVFMLKDTLLLVFGNLRMLDMGGYGGRIYITLGWGGGAAVLLMLVVAGISVLGLIRPRKTISSAKVDLGDAFLQ